MDFGKMRVVKIRVSSRGSITGTRNVSLRRIKCAMNECHKMRNEAIALGQSHWNNADPSLVSMFQSVVQGRTDFIMKAGGIGLSPMRFEYDDLVSIFFWAVSCSCCDASLAVAPSWLENAMLTELWIERLKGFWKRETRLFLCNEGVTRDISRVCGMSEFGSCSIRKSEITLRLVYERWMDGRRSEFQGRLHKKREPNRVR